MPGTYDHKFILDLQRECAKLSARNIPLKPIETESYEACPICGSYNISFMRTNDRYGEAPEPFQCDYCPDCGQKLEW